ncbi:MAG: hypothetical protein NBV68_02020 [Erythrobacter sp.]|nr:hypothetical protein [Erythrobacter sp.]
MRTILNSKGVWLLAEINRPSGPFDVVLGAAPSCVNHRPGHAKMGCSLDPKFFDD